MNITLSIEPAASATAYSGPAYSGPAAKEPPRADFVAPFALADLVEVADRFGESIITLTIGDKWGSSWVYGRGHWNGDGVPQRKEEFMQRSISKLITQIIEKDLYK